MADYEFVELSQWEGLAVKLHASAHGDYLHLHRLLRC
jgi:hypothetical protein